MQRITNNWSLKLISVVLAVLLWSHVRGEVNPLETTSVDVPLVVTPPPGLDFRGELPTKVTVLLQGPRVSLRNIKGGALANPLAPSDQAPNIVEGAVRATLKVENARPGEQKLAVRATSNVADVEVLRVTPPDIPVTLERVRPNQDKR
jgi:hypothetical protein